MKPLTLNMTLPAATASEYLRLSQAAAGRHLEELGLAGTVEAQGLAWVIIRVRGEVFVPPAENLTVTTWPGKEKLGMMPRYCEMRNPDGTLALRISTIWVLADIHTRQMRADASAPVPDMSRGDEPPFPRSLPRKELPLLGSFVPGAAQIDVNGHMNNAAYPDAAMTFLPAEYQGKPICGFAVDYRQEILPKTHIDVFGGGVEDGFLFCGKSEAAEHFRMKLTFG